MWPFKNKPITPATDGENKLPHPLALRICEIEQQIEHGFWSYNGGKVAGAFSVVAQMLAEQEERISRLETPKDA